MIDMGASQLMTLRYPDQMSYILNSLTGAIWGILGGTTIGGTKGDTRSLDYGSNDKGVL